MVESACVMKLLRAWLLVLWSVPRRRFVECGLGTTPIGMLYMPGSKSGPNDGENQFA